MKRVLLVFLICLLGACSINAPRIDHAYSALSQGSRVRFIVIHYTVDDLPDSIKSLTGFDVSSHYLLSDTQPPFFYQLVDESRQASHAGLSSWKGYTYLNSNSIGIEIVNPGYTESPAGRIWHPYAPAQIEQLIALLKQIVARHHIRPENILGHSDIAPQRKQDPGPLFPWQQLAAAGLITWPNAGDVARARSGFEQQLPSVSWFQQKLAQHGFLVPQNGELDDATRNVVAAFQMKYRQTKFDGELDAETAALLEVLITKAEAGLSTR